VNHWQRLRLGEIIELEYGRSLPVPKRRDGVVPVYGSNGQTGWHDEALIEGPAIIVGRKGSIGKVHYVSVPSFPIDTTYFVKIKNPDALELRFAYYLLEGSRITELNSATGVPGLNREHAYNEPIVLPPVGEQRRIVELLDRAGEIRRRIVAAYAKARAVVPALFLDKFGDPASNPKGWQMATLGDIIVRITGGKNIEAGNGTSKYRIMKVSAVTSGIFKPNEAKPAPDDHIPAPDHHVRDGDFLFSRANTSELVGGVAIAHKPPDGLLLPDKIWRIEWDREKVDRKYAYSLLRTSEIRRVFALIGSGTSGSMKNISQAKLLRVSVPLPPLLRQKAFAEQVDRLEALERHLDSAAAKADAMVAGLSAEVFA
jgi:type I restriction enzyme S subunit